MDEYTPQRKIIQGRPNHDCGVLRGEKMEYALIIEVAVQGSNLPKLYSKLIQEEKEHILN